MCDELREKIEKYLDKAKPLFLELATCAPPEVDLEKAASEVHEMALAYYNDALHFHEQGEYANALAALEYAEGWMDAGKRIGILK